MAKLGAREDTLKEFIEVLGDNEEKIERLVTNFAHWKDSKFELKMANGIFVKNGIALSKSFETSLLNNFSALVRNIALGTSAGEKVINDWIRKQTKGLIDNAIKDTNSDDLAILVNTVYMKGKWVKTFSPSPRKYDFETATGDTVEAHMMQKECIFDYYTDRKNHYRIAFFEYEVGENLADQWEMGVLLPDQQLGRNYNIAHFLRFISPKNMRQFNNTRLPAKLDVLLPKVKVRATIDLIPLLQNFGIQSAFCKNKANFLGIT